MKLSKETGILMLVSVYSPLCIMFILEKNTELSIAMLVMLCILNCIFLGLLVQIISSKLKKKPARPIFAFEPPDIYVAFRRIFGGEDYE